MVVAVGQDHAGSGVGDDPAVAGLRVGGIERQVRAARLEHAESRTDLVGRLLHEYRHDAARCKHMGGDEPGPLIRLSIQLGIGQLA